MENLPAERLDRVFRDLYPDYDPGRIDESVTLSGYAPFFRVLYNASYLERDASERALDYLARPANRNGIAAGVPKTVEVASSFGHGTIPVSGNAGEPEVSEIGIVYHAGRPYLLGIVARATGKDLIGQVSDDVSEALGLGKNGGRVDLGGIHNSLVHGHGKAEGRSLIMTSPVTPVGHVLLNRRSDATERLVNFAETVKQKGKAAVKDDE